MNGQNGAMRAPHATRDPALRRLETWISNLLRGGIILSVSLIVVGTLTTFVQHPDYISSSAQLERLVAPGAAFPHALDVLLAGLHQLRGEAIATLGLLVLIATPMIRVAVSSIAFIRQRDRIYFLITTAVLCLLLLSLVLGKSE